MIALKSITSLIELLTLLIAYFATIAPAGCFAAWLTKKMGDDTAQEAGFLTLNPLVHVDMFGLFVLLLLSTPRSAFGWGQRIPVNPFNIYGPRRTVRLWIAYFAQAIAHFGLAVLSVVGFGLLLGEELLIASQSNITSWQLTLVRLLITFLSLNVSLVLIYLVINIVVIIGFTVSEKKQQPVPYLDYVLLFAPLAVLLLFGNELRWLIWSGIVMVESGVKSLIALFI